MAEFQGTVTEKVRVFIEEVEQLCIKHKLQITTESYDQIQVYDIDNLGPIYGAISDETEEKP